MMKLSEFEIEYGYAVNVVPISWADVAVGRKMKIFSRNFAKDKANAILNSGDYQDLFVELLDTDDEIDSIRIVDKIIALENIGSCEHHATAEKKLLLILLSWLYENQSAFIDPLGVVEEIYAEFDYPEEIEQFVRYMPSKLPDLGSRSNNEKQLVRIWGEYVAESKEKF